MKSSMVATLLAAAGLLVFSSTGCGSGGSVNANPDLPAQDLVDTAKADAPAEVTEEIAPFDLGEIKVLDLAEIEPEPGEFGSLCTENTDCFSSFCVPTPTGNRCTKVCLDDCPAGWTCVKAASDPDVIYICVPRFANLCNPCDTNQQCTIEGTESANLDLCLSSGAGGSFCGVDCSADSTACPADYECKEITTPGGTFQQCMPVSGTCTCTPLAVQKESKTTCSIENEFGVCKGERVCRMEGLTDCDAATPAAERCDDVDNDCDGYTDEGCDDDKDGFCDKSMVTIGTPAVCGNGGGDCNDADDSVFPDKTEICDQKDNNCNGEIDEGLCDDGDPCTDNICDPATSNCSFPYNEAPCSDSNECTVNDKCNNGTCAGAQKDCNDGNPCTDDLCNPLAQGGCYWPPNSNPCTDDGNPCTQDICENGTCQHKPATGIPCNDQNPCTDGDLCTSGQCIPGPPKVCKDDNECTKDECDPEQGCTFKVMQGMSCVYDVFDLGICKIPGTCGSSGCVPQANCNTCTPPCSLCVCCAGMSLCLF